MRDRRSARRQSRAEESGVSGFPKFPVRTLAEIRLAGSLWFYLSCEICGCGNCAAVPLTPLIIRWGPEALRTRLNTGFRCSRRGGRSTTVSWPNSEGRPDYGAPPVPERYRWTGKAIWPDPLIMHYLTEIGGGGFDGLSNYHPVLGSIRFGDMCNLYSNTKTRDALRCAACSRSRTTAPMLSSRCRRSFRSRWRRSCGFRPTASARWCRRRGVSRCCKRAMRRSR